MRKYPEPDPEAEPRVRPQRLHYDRFFAAYCEPRHYLNAQKLASVLVGMGYPVQAYKRTGSWVVSRSYDPELLQSVTQDLNNLCASEVARIAAMHDLEGVTHVYSSFALEGHQHAIEAQGATRLHCGCDSGQRVFLVPSLSPVARCSECDGLPVQAQRPRRLPPPPPKLLYLSG